MANVYQEDPLESDPSESRPFDLDIRVIEFGEAADLLLEVTDNGCEATCPESCPASAVAP